VDARHEAGHDEFQNQRQLLSVGFAFKKFERKIKSLLRN